MRYGIFSDVHSNLEALEAVLAAYNNESIDRYLCVGDIVGYGANPKECIEKIKTLAGESVAGNHDWASVDLFPADYFNPLAKEAVSWTARNLDTESKSYLKQLKLVYKNDGLTLVHGTLNDPQDFNYMTDAYIAQESFGLLDTDICFVGHTHVAEVFVRDSAGRIRYQRDNLTVIREGNRYIVNVGSVGQPRDGNPQAAFCVYDTERKTIQLKRIAYDVQTARKKIREAGLPQFLGDRLLSGS